MGLFRAPRRVKWPVVAQDPGLRVSAANRKVISTTTVALPDERLDEGPRGYRFAVIDYDASRNKMYAPWRAPIGQLTNRNILTDPRVHAQNVFALASYTLDRFERALGRRIPWGFNGQQLKIAPHAFQEANAFYSRDAQALLFGYFPSRNRRWIYTCIAHDVVVHETTHAIIDGLRERYLDNSHVDQAAFHEGFADVVALLSVFSMRDVVETLLVQSRVIGRSGLIDRQNLTAKALRKSQLLGLADELGQELSGLRGEVLRRSASLDPADVDLSSDEFAESHRRGEVLVAAVLDAFVGALEERLRSFGDRRGRITAEQVIEEASTAAETLLCLAIRAIDYSPPVDVRLADYLCAMITSDSEIRPDDGRYGFRARLLQSFAKFGVEVDNSGKWDREDASKYTYVGGHADPLAYSPEEVHRFIWANRERLQIPEDAYTHVFSVQPCRISQPDGFVVSQTVCQYKQTTHLRGRDLQRHRLPRPKGLDPDGWIKLNGGGVLIFDEFLQLQYHIHQRLFGRTQRERLKEMEFRGQAGSPGRGVDTASPFAAIHEGRSYRDRASRTR